MTIYVLMSVYMLNGAITVPQPQGFGTHAACETAMLKLTAAHPDNAYVCAAVKVGD